MTHCQRVREWDPAMLVSASESRTELENESVVCFPIKGSEFATRNSHAFSVSTDYGLRFVPPANRLHPVSIDSQI